MKPLGQKAYGSIGHLPESRLGPSDSCVPEGQARICTVETRDEKDLVIVQEKLDGSCCAVAKVNNQIVPLGRSGYTALSSPYEMHHLFHDWVMAHEYRFRHLLSEGERAVGEWMAQAHGTIYDLSNHEPFSVFDIIRGTRRVPYFELCDRTHEAGQQIVTPILVGRFPVPVSVAMKAHESMGIPRDQTEGVVYRVERNGEVDFLAKYVRPDKVDGKYLKTEPIWNWHPRKKVGS